MAKLITNSTPKADGFRMPGEFEEQKQIFMIWPERTDNWRVEHQLKLYIDSFLFH